MAPRPFWGLGFLIWGALCASLPLAGVNDARAAADRPTVVELYTSQGCGSCLSANNYLRKLAQRKDILALTLHVTYWDYLGWEDTFAMPENDARQRAYAEAAASGEIYTPQVVIDGEHREIGSDIPIIEEIIASQIEIRPPAIGIGLHLEPRAVTVNIEAGTLPKGAQSATIWLIQYDDQQQVSIERGENSGKRLSYVNVVRQMTPLGTWRGEGKGLLLPLRELRRSGHSGMAVVLQVDNAGPILGAAKADIGIFMKWP